MKLYEIFNEKEIKLINNIVSTKDKEYSKEELRVIARKIEDDIMGESTKNNNIVNLLNQYNGIINTLEKAR